MTIAATEYRRSEKKYRQTIDAPPEVVFPLLCPVREAEWLDGWASTMIYSASGLIEAGAVFTTSSEGEADTVWVVSRHDASAGRVDFVRVTPSSRTCLLQLLVAPCGARRSHVDVSYAYTSLSRAGSEFLDTWTPEAFLQAMTFWERSMNHFLRTGTRLPRVAA